MEAIEFHSKLKNGLIKIPNKISSKLIDGQDVRVIVLFEETHEDKEFNRQITKKFFDGFAESDSIYDDL